MTNSMRRLTHFNRSDKNLPLTIRTNALPPRELFESLPDVLAEYDALVTLLDAEKQHHRDAAAKSATATKASEDYRKAVHDAMSAGKDPSSIKDKAPLLTAEAKSHGTFADQAKNKADRQAQILGDAIKPVAASLFEAAEGRMTTGAAQVAAVLDDLKAAWLETAGGWEARHWLSRAHHQGGGQAWQGVSIPAEVEDAFNVITSALANLDALKHDETELDAWRDKQAMAEAHNASGAAPTRQWFGVRA